MSVFLLFWQPVIVLCYFAIFVLFVLIARWQINMMMMNVKPLNDRRSAARHQGINFTVSEEWLPTV